MAHIFVSILSLCSNTTSPKNWHLGSGHPIKKICHQISLTDEQKHYRHFNNNKNWNLPSDLNPGSQNTSHSRYPLDQTIRSAVVCNYSAGLKFNGRFTARFTIRNRLVFIFSTKRTKLLDLVCKYYTNKLNFGRIHAHSRYFSTVHRSEIKINRYDSLGFILLFNWAVETLSCCDLSLPKYGL